jgi:hypothetical protein
MLKLFCLGWVVAVTIGTVFRFVMLAQGLSEANLLPKSWRRWLYGVNLGKKTS